VARQLILGDPLKNSNNFHLWILSFICDAETIKVELCAPLNPKIVSEVVDK
jgi:hypothetical protein